jgi:hypothetical protein
VEGFPSFIRWRGEASLRCFDRVSPRLEVCGGRKGAMWVPLYSRTLWWWCSFDGCAVVFVSLRFTVNSGKQGGWGLFVMVILTTPFFFFFFSFLEV